MNAILFCAGVGRRFQPISFSCPKPLTPINGVPIVEQTLRMLRGSDIGRITLVVGYMAEKFAYLKDKYNVEFVYNPEHDTRNTHSSLLLAADRLDGSLLIDGDVVFLKNVLSRVQPGKSQFVCQPTVHGLEWEVFPDETGRIVRVEKWTATGHSMCGLSYWEGKTAATLADELKRCAPDDYWEEAVLKILPSVPVYATLIEEPFLQETDTIKDALHYGLITHEEIAQLSSVDFPPVRLKGLTNSTWQVRDNSGIMRCLRIPGHGTDSFIDREQEPAIYGLIKHLEITPESVFFPGGLKMTRFMSDHRVAVSSDLELGFFKSLATALAKLNGIHHTAESPLQPMLIGDQILKFESLTGKSAPPLQRAWLLEKASMFDSEPQVLCHRDLALENILVSGGHGQDIQIIDFEYAGFAHPLWEVASFILESGMNAEAREEFARCCGVTNAGEGSRLWEMESLVDYVWGLWGLERGYIDYSNIKLKRMLRRLQAVTE